MYGSFQSSFNPNLPDRGAVLNTLFGLHIAFALTFVEFFPSRADKFPPPHCSKKRQERRDASCWSKLFRTRALRNWFLFSANSGASGCGCSRILYCRHLGHSCELISYSTQAPLPLRFLKGRKSYFTSQRILYPSPT